MPNKSVRLGLILIGIFHAVNGLYMFATPAAWYAAIPGVAATGPFNPHFVMDIGLAFLASGVGLILGGTTWSRAGSFAIAGAAFPLLHAGLHGLGLLRHGLPHDPDVLWSEFAGVIGISIAGAALAWLRNRQSTV